MVVNLEWEGGPDFQIDQVASQIWYLVQIYTSELAPIDVGGQFTESVFKLGAAIPSKHLLLDQIMCQAIVARRDAYSHERYQ